MYLGLIQLVFCEYVSPNGLNEICIWLGDVVVETFYPIEKS